MGTNVRPDISLKNRYWIERHRYYELKHFCLQYPIWQKSYKSLDGYCSKSGGVIETRLDTGVSDPTAKFAEARLYFLERMQMIESAAAQASDEFGSYILDAVTKGLSYEHLKAKQNIPCCKEIYYDLYRRFFWLLSRARN